MTVKSISPSANSEERRETGLSLIVVGFMVWCFDAFVFFFMPAGLRLGEQRPFFLLVGTALIFGAGLICTGVYLRKNRSSAVAKSQ